MRVLKGLSPSLLASSVMYKGQRAKFHAHIFPILHTSLRRSPFPDECDFCNLVGCPHSSVAGAAFMVVRAVKRKIGSCVAKPLKMGDEKGSSRNFQSL